jgi:thiol-disulfide isomerase/thioredoxin/Leucine-rich repeat (LRR) protein
VLFPVLFVILFFAILTGRTDNTTLVKENSNEVSGKMRTLYFPMDCSLGWLYIRDKGTEGWEGWDKLGEAQGVVQVAQNKEIRLNITDETFNNLSCLSNLWPNDLQEVSISSKNLKDADLEPLKELIGLRKLILVGPLTNKGLADIKEIKSLKELHLSRTQVDDDGLVHLKTLRLLERIYLWGDSRINGVGFRHFKDSKSLRLISFYKTPINDVAMEYFSRIRPLEELHLQYTNVTDEGLGYLKGLPNLKSLVLPPGTTNKGLANLKGLDSIEKLHISDTQITDEGLLYLKDIKSLKSLAVSSNLMTGKGLIHLKEMPSLESLEVSLSMINDASLANLEDLPVTNLYLSRSTISDTGLAHIAKLKSLEKLFLDNTGITDIGMVYLASLTSLKHLSLKGTRITDAGLANLRRLVSLEQLKLQRTNITDAGLSHLKNLPNLRGLYLGRTQITDAGLCELNGITSLRYLSLLGCPVSDKGLNHLKDLSSLEFLGVNGTKVTPIGAGVIKQALPTCQVEGVEIIVENPTVADISEEEQLMTGKPAPELRIEKLLQAPEGAIASLDELKGKVVVLEFWATWCGPCIRSFPHINGIAEKFQNQPVQFISITDEPEAVVTDFLKKHLLRTWVAIDMDRTIFEAYHIKGRPRIIVINAKGIIVDVTLPMSLTEESLNNILTQTSLLQKGNK